MDGHIGRKLIGLVLAVLPVLAFPSASARAKEILRERFEQVNPGVPTDSSVSGKDGRRGGYSRTEKEFWLNRSEPYLDLPVAFPAGVRGSISFDLQRKAGDVPEDRRTLFEMLDGSGGQLLFVQIRWSSEFDPGRPMLFLRGREYWKNGLGLWGPEILLDRGVTPGQWIHVDLAWDDGEKRYLLYVDGRLQDVSPKAYDRKSRTVLPDPRIAANDLMAKTHAPPHFASNPFSSFLSRARTFRIGVNSHARAPYGASSPLSNAVLDNFVVLADELPKGLGASAITSVTDDTFKVPGISGKLVAGDKVTAVLLAAPGGKASFDMGSVKGIPMEEVPPTEGAPGIPAVSPGTFRGSYTVKPGDDYEDGFVVGHFVSADNVAAEPVASASKWTIETKPKVTFSIDKKDLPADSTTKARIKLAAKDANGNPVQGRRLKLTLATTDEYTGLVGAGDFGKNVGASVETRWKGETDAWGEVEFDYVAGFAAKSVILTAKDLDSGGVTVDYITAYKEASIDIALTPPVNRAAARRGIQYIVKVEASRTELTADGRSRSVIRATVMDPNGVPVAGDPVEFSLSTPNGTLRIIQGKTDSSGVATAEYIAGKKIGIVVVTATATLRNVSGNVSITLLSDAPAKIYLAAKPDTLPADGFSRSDLSVKVTDINDNPNADTKVEFRVSKGGGKVEYADRVTDRFGDASNRYTSGTTPGVATVVATVRSKVPTEAELAKARNVLFAPYSPEGDEIRVEKWLKKKGDAFVKGDPLVEYTVGRGSTVYQLIAPYDGTMGEVFVEYWDNAEVGQTLAIMNPAAK